MNEYELDGSELVPRERASERAQSLGSQSLGNKPLDQEWDSQRQRPASRGGATTSVMTTDDILGAARGRLRRLSPDEAYEAVLNTAAVFVDIRAEGQRAIEGNIPGALIIKRNVLEWRFDPASGARMPVATSHDLQVIVFCSEGYTSSIAAVALRDLGLWRATDVVGGFHAWRASGLPIVLPPGA